MAAKLNIPVAKVAAALRKHGGIFSLAARELGCDRANISQRVSSTPALQQVCREIEESFGDLAEGVIKNTLSERVGGQPTKDAKQMARWYAGIKLGERGYVRRLAGPDGEPLAVAPGGSGPSVHFHITYVDGPGEQQAIEGSARVVGDVV